MPITLQIIAFPCLEYKILESESECDEITYGVTVVNCKVVFKHLSVFCHNSR